MCSAVKVKEQEMNCVRVWGGLRMVEVLRMELGLFEKD